MKIDRSHRHKSVAAVLIWSSIVLLSLSSGTYCLHEDQILRGKRATEVRPYSAADLQAINLIRELIQRRQQQQYGMTQMNNGDTLSENSPDIEKSPSILLLQALRSILGDESKEEVKRNSYLGLCHFKICNLGRKRSGLAFAQRYQK